MRDELPHLLGFEPSFHIGQRQRASTVDIEEPQAGLVDQQSPSREVDPAPAEEVAEVIFGKRA